MWTSVSKWSALHVSAGALVCISSRMLLGVPGFVYSHLSVLDQETAVVSSVRGRGCVSVSVAVVQHKSEHVSVGRVRLCLCVPVRVSLFFLFLKENAPCGSHRHPETSQPAQVSCTDR